MFILARAVVYATLFVGFLLVFLPARVLEWSGVTTPPLGAPQIVGAIVALAGAAIAVSCVLAFVFIGRGTPAPFDAPRQLVVRGPYRFVRNPMYLGAGMALLGAALYYESLALATYALVFLLVAHVFVTGYEEPTLRRTFGPAYEEYCRRVGRWWPRKLASS
ncbi:MAG TPA: isoprenylcysteine carboxylmethyltransferase family protein [Gemmatimonadaceae bacterium]|jgi:protein-S-isoprenylcysteine O-methyltransferase Ste14